MRWARQRGSETLLPLHKATQALPFLPKRTPRLRERFGLHSHSGPGLDQVCRRSDAVEVIVVIRKSGAVAGGPTAGSAVLVHRVFDRNNHLREGDASGIFALEGLPRNSQFELGWKKEDQWAVAHLHLFTFD